MVRSVGGIEQATSDMLDVFTTIICYGNKVIQINLTNSVFWYSLEWETGKLGNIMPFESDISV